ncbi:hypothetical protein F7725_009072 [Dissostichus mawsoni]|uniref:Uncharacterized protein n=1 Tax=Dissostichus mawsoni TaxID=36200 RepID=A0A7J5Z6R0_DISMA|nr:hypothetical protein F7725_009072 [Dissostichus mawsoni]
MSWKCCHDPPPRRLGGGTFLHERLCSHGAECRRGRWDTVTVSVNFLFLIPAPKASWTPEAPRHFEESQWGPEKRASEERKAHGPCERAGVSVSLFVFSGSQSLTSNP